MSESDILRNALRPGPECLPLELLSERLELAAEDPMRRAAQVHLDQCLHCRTELDLLHEFESGVIRPDEVEAVRWITNRLAQTPAPPPVRTSAGRWWSPRMLAGFGTAAALLVLAAGLATQWSSRRGADVPITDFGEDRMRSTSIEIVSDPGSFAWKAVPGASDYELTVRLVDGAIIFHNFVTKQILAYPSEVATTVSSGKLVVWEVVARDASHNPIARSGVQKFRQKSAPPSDGR